MSSDNAKLRLLGKNWSFYMKNISYVIESNISLATTMLLVITIGLINCNHNVIGYTEDFEESLK